MLGFGALGLRASGLRFFGLRVREFRVSGSKQGQRLRSSVRTEEIDRLSHPKRTVPRL